MKKILTLLLLLSTYIFSNINAVVSIMPQKTFLKAIGGDKVNISLMVEPGNSPHTYEPKPSQMVAVSKADLYFVIDIEFEHVWLEKFTNLNKNMKIVDISKGIDRLTMASGGCHTCSAHGSHSKSTVKESISKDPHIWTSPKNIKIIAQNMYDTLVVFDAKNQAYYKKNLDTFLAYVDSTDKTVTEIFSNFKGSRSFIVFHPSWDYFAKAYGLEQIAIEVEGKSPKPKELMALVKNAREKKVSAIFTQPEFSDTSAKIIANELQIPVVKVSHLAPEWSENLIKMAKTITGTK